MDDIDRTLPDFHLEDFYADHTSVLRDGWLGR